jgi:hypothetical protein
MKLLKEFVASPNPPQPVNPTETVEDLLAKKEQFAELSLRETDAFKIGLAIYPNDTGRALRVATEWPNDPQVKALRQSFVDAEEDGETAFLPTKADACRLAWNIARDADKFTEDRLKALKLYGEMRGFIEKPAAVTVNNTQNVAMRVLVVKDYGTNDDWEKALRSQQKKLINGEYSASGN